MYELTNDQRKYFGLDPIAPTWERVILQGDRHRPDTILYFDGDVIKRQIISTEKEYKELHFDEATRHREVLLPKTARGKEQKLNASNFEKRTPIGIYLSVSDYGELIIASNDTQMTFYDSLWENDIVKGSKIPDLIADFINTSPDNHFEAIASFKQQKRQHHKFKKGDYFRFKLSRTAYGFGRILLDIDKLRKSKLLPPEHKLFWVMGKPVLVQLFAYASPTKEVDLELLKAQTVLPSSVMMDNAFFYGEYEVFAHDSIADELYDFPMSLYQTATTPYETEDTITLQWGLLQLEMPTEEFNHQASATLKQTLSANSFVNNSIGFKPSYANYEVLSIISGGVISDSHWIWKEDLRNPLWHATKVELCRLFGLNPDSYTENCKKLGVLLPSAISG